jgi:2-phosphosulfolactate phosphatase
MRVLTRSGADAAAAEGCVVVIDVLRAFTTAAFAFHAGASEIWLCSSTEEALALRRRAPAALLVGEIGGRAIPGFDHGNSPSALQDLDLRGRIVILRTSNGTQGVARAVHASSILLGSLVCAAATARHVRGLRPDTVTLLSMGWIGEPPVGPAIAALPGAPDSAPPGAPDSASVSAPPSVLASAIEGAEDHACAGYLAALLAGAPGDSAAAIRATEQSPAGQRALDPAFPLISPADLACATAVDRFDFAMPVTLRDGVLVARAVPA